MKKGTLLQVVQLGHGVIRQKAKDVKNINDAEIQKLIDDMEATCMDVDGVGIAAPQVYKSLNIFIVASHPNSRYPKAPKIKPYAVINPKIVSKSKAVSKDWEGCLSIPGIRGILPRHTSTIVQYTNRDGKQEKKNWLVLLPGYFSTSTITCKGMLSLIKQTPET